MNYLFLTSQYVMKICCLNLNFSNDNSLGTFYLFIYFYYYYFLLYNIVLVLPYIDILNSKLLLYLIGSISRDL